MAAFVCAECKRIVHEPHEQFCERMEYRRADAHERRLSSSSMPRSLPGLRRQHRPPSP